MEIMTIVSFLGICSLADLKKREINLMFLAIFGIAGLVFHLYNQRLLVQQLLGGIAIGAVLYAISVLSKEKIGKGDAILLMMTGIYLGFWDNLFLLWRALVFAGIYGAVLLLIRKKTKKEEMAFVPFLFLSYIVTFVGKCL